MATGTNQGGECWGLEGAQLLEQIIYTRQRSNAISLWTRMSHLTSYGSITGITISAIDVLNQFLDENKDILEERTDGVTGIGVGGIPFWRIDSWWEKLFQLLSQAFPHLIVYGS